MAERSEDPYTPLSLQETQGDSECPSVNDLRQFQKVLIASASGSQLALYLYGAGAMIWVVSSHKIVPDRDPGFKRIYEYSFPREDERAREPTESAAE